MAKSRRFNAVSLPADAISICCQIESSDSPLKEKEIAETPRLKQRLGLTDSTPSPQGSDIGSRCIFGPDLATFFNKLINSQSFKNLSLCCHDRWFDSSP